MPAGSAKKLLKQVQEGEKDYHFIEVRAAVVSVILTWSRWVLT